MAIDYITDIRSLYAGSVGADAAYTSRVDAGLRDETSEQDILTTLAVVEAHIRLLRDRDEARLLHYALSRLMTAAGSGGFVFEDLGLDVIGSTTNPTFAPADDIEIVYDLATPASANVAVGGTGTLADLVAAINGTVAISGAGIVASINRGRLQLTMDDGSLAASENRRYAPGFAIGTGGANNEAARKAGMEKITHRNALDVIADRVRDEALDFFQTESREDPLDDYFRKTPERA